MIDQLLETLKGKAHQDGVAFAQEEFLLHRLDCDREKLGLAIEALESRGAITVLSSLPFLTVKLRMWPGRAQNSAEVSHPPYSYSSSGNISKQSYSHRDPDELDGLLGEVMGVLGVDDPEPFKRIVEVYTPHVIRRALDRVKKAQTIQKSRTALFRYLLPRIAKEASTHT